MASDEKSFMPLKEVSHMGAALLYRAEIGLSLLNVRAGCRKHCAYKPLGKGKRLPTVGKRNPDILRPIREPVAAQRKREPCRRTRDASAERTV